MTPISKLLSSAALALAAFSAHAQPHWEYITKTDAMTDVRAKVALISLPGEAVLSVYKRPDSAAAMLDFRLHPNNPGRIAKKPIMVRFDKHPPHTLGLPAGQNKGTGEPALQWGPQKIAVQIWDGKSGDVYDSNTFMREFLNSSTLLLRYWKPDGRSEDIEFNLIGAENSVPLALFDEAKLIAAERRKEEEGKLGRATGQAVIRCAKQPGTKACLDRLSTCIDNSGSDEAAVLRCTDG